MSDWEVLTWADFGHAVRDLAQQVAADGYRPEIIVCIARGGLLAAGAISYALNVKNVHVMRRRTERWIDFPWSSLPPLVPDQRRPARPANTASRIGTGR